MSSSFKNYKTEQIGADLNPILLTGRFGDSEKLGGGGSK